MGDTRSLPLLPLRSMMIFPYMIIHLDVARDRSVAALEAAMLADKHEIFLVAQKNVADEKPEQETIYDIGTVTVIRQTIKMPGGAVRVLVEGIRRGRILSYQQQEKYDQVEIEEYTDAVDDSLGMEALVRLVAHQFEQWVKISKKIPPETLVSVSILDDAGRLCDLIASHLNLKLEVKQDLLALIDVKARLEKMYAVLARELELLEIERKIGLRVHRQMEKVQKDFYLREQIKAIRKELGDPEDRAEEIAAYREKLAKGNYPDEVKKCIEKELARMERMSGMVAELGVIQNYLECLFDLPWEEEQTTEIVMEEAEKILNADHYGLEKVKERILEYLAVHKLAKDKVAPILCLVGPPGVGKTSLATSVARATRRKFVRASLGGVRDEAEIRGHRRTYVGAMPGRIIEGIRRAGTKNPVFLLDEVDKLAADYRGDPSAALLEVLDPAQNKTFNDHFVDLPFDLSKVLWIVTANDLGGIPLALKDRLEIITLSSYTEMEKTEIAKRYLITRQREQNGLKAREIQFGAGVIEKIIADFTREAGVRELERVIGSVCRKVARKIVDGERKSFRVTTKNLYDLLGRAKYSRSKAAKKPQIGVCTGMAWTAVGGCLLPTEATVLKGKGKLILTGHLGDVMQESAKAGLSYIRSRSDEFSLPVDFYEKEDIHIHLPEGAIPKDGPSAGITMATAMISALTKQKVRSDVAMTGEITLRGNVLPIGGLKEKVLAAYREGMHTIILPKENERDIEDIPETVRDSLEFVPVETMDEVLATALVKK